MSNDFFATQPDAYARDFLASVVPWGHGYITVHWRRPGLGMPGRSFQTIDAALAFVAELKATQFDIYFCTSSQKLNCGHRDRENALGLVCIPIDTDVKPDSPEHYSTLAEALANVFWRCDQLGIPRPSLVVASGGGLHCYWLSDRVLTVEEWQPFADALKTAFKNAGLKFDAGVTGDAARVLRVPGTINWKLEGKPRPVRLLPKYCTGIRHDFAVVFAELLKLAPARAAARKPNLKLLGPVPKAMQHLEIRSLGRGIEGPPPLDFEVVKTNCGWLREAYETGGKDFDQPQWNLTTLCATFFENGNELAHKLGNQHPDYADGEKTEVLWNRKIRERAEKNLGWPRCQTIANNGSKFCKTCPHFPKGKSPLHPAILPTEAIKTVKREPAEKSERAAEPDETSEPDAAAKPDTTEKSEWHAARDAIFDRVARTITNARLEALANAGLNQQRKDLKKQLAELEAELNKWPVDRKQQPDLERRRMELIDQLINLPDPPVTLLVSPTGSYKSTLARAAAVQYVTERPDKTVVILVPRHKLGDEQVDDLQREHPNGNYTAAVWRGRHAWDPHVGNGHEQQMCRRGLDAALVERAMIDVNHLCKRGRGDKAIKCPLFDSCAFQKQKQAKAKINIWFAAHECIVHEMPERFGDVGWVIVDESPLDAFVFGVDVTKPITLQLDSLKTPLPVDQKPFAGDYSKLMLGRKALYYALDKLQIPAEPQQGVAVSRESLKQFIKPPGGGNGLYASEMHNLTFRGLVDPGIDPNMTGEKLKIKLLEAATNDTIKKEVMLWGLVMAAAANTVSDMLKKRMTPEKLIQLLEARAAKANKSYGRIQIQRDKEGRVIRMVGLNGLKTGWGVPTLVCDATGDAELLKPIWPQLEEPEPHGWEQLPRPDNVRIYQCVNRTFSMDAIAVEGGDKKRKADSARRMYAAVLKTALAYGGQTVGVIVYKSTRKWIEANCFVPEWIEWMHWGDLTGTNIVEKARALFMIGRPFGSGEVVTRTAEALFGDHIADRDYWKLEKQGVIPILPDAYGNTSRLVDVWRHPHPMAERLRRQITEGGLHQGGGRPRAGLRKQDEPLDIHIWTNVPLPEFGPVEPVIWTKLDAGLDGLMLATAGVWLKNSADAVRAFNGIFTAQGIRKARMEAGEIHGRGAENRGVLISPINISTGPINTPLVQNVNVAPAGPVFRINYRRASPGCKLTEALFLKGVANKEITDPRAWLENKLGPLDYFEIVDYGEPVCREKNG